jgi:hypothetical protein
VKSETIACRRVLESGLCAVITPSLTCIRIKNFSACHVFFRRVFSCLNYHSSFQSVRLFFFIFSRSHIRSALRVFDLCASVPSLNGYFREREWQNAALCELLHSHLANKSALSSSLAASSTELSAAARRVLTHFDSIATPSYSTPKHAVSTASWAPAASKMADALRAALQRSQDIDVKVTEVAKSVKTAAAAVKSAPTKATKEGKTPRRPSPRPL